MSFGLTENLSLGKEYVTEMQANCNTQTHSSSTKTQIQPGEYRVIGISGR